MADEQYRLNVYRWRDVLERAYDAAPGPPGAGVTVAMMQATYNSMMDLYDKYIHIPRLAGVEWAGRSGFKRRRLIRQFRTWHKDALAFGQRLEGYWSDSCLPADPCPEAPQPAYTERWVAAPVFDGVWPDDYYLGLAVPGRPDAVELAALWNQVVSVKDVVDNIGESADQLFLEMLQRAGLETQLEGANAALDRLMDGLEEIFEGFTDALWYVGAALAGWLVYTVAKK